MFLNNILKYIFCERIFLHFFKKNLIKPEKEVLENNELSIEKKITTEVQIQKKLKKITKIYLIYPTFFLKNNFLKKTIKKGVTNERYWY